MNCDHDGLAAKAVIEGVSASDPAAVREMLDPITEGDAVTRSAVDAAVSDTSKLLATAETRVELVENAYEDALAAADPVAGVPIVGHRLDGFGSRLSAVESRVATLRLDVPADVLEAPQVAYDLATELRDVATTAQAVAVTADDLSSDLDRFESWLARPSQRYGEFAEDVDLVAESLDGINAAADALPDTPDEPATRWADLTMQAAVLSLLVADLDAELAGLRTLAESADEPLRDDLRDRLDRVRRRVVDVESTLSGMVVPSWRDRYAADLDAFEAELATFGPPVEWGAVERTLAAHRPVDPAV